MDRSVSGGHHLIIALKCCPAGTTDAVGAGPVLMLGGKQQKLGGPQLAYYTDNEPCTAIGIDKAGRHLWLVVVDGRQANYSDGMPLSELTAMLRGLGADSAMNMDGGGSSTMVLRRDGQPRIVNSPIHTGIPGRERPVGNQLGIISIASSP
jgi:exopolysaccharide biosynthesis protein